MSIFEKRVNLKPFEYPQLYRYVDAIRSSYWVHTEYSFTGDIQDFKAELNNKERETIKRAMLAIAQIEVNVKTFWGDIYRHIPKPEVSSVGFTFADCHIEWTEVLTPKWWVDFRDINIWDKVAQWDNGVIKFVNAIHKTEQYYEWDIYNINKTTLDANVSPKHRIIYKNHKWELCEGRADSISFNNSDNRLPESWVLKWENIKLSPLDILSIAIQADWCQRYNNSTGNKRWTSKDCNTYEISVKKERKKERLKHILEVCGYKYREFKIQREGYVKYEIDVPFFDRENMKSFNWVDLSNKDTKWCEDFIQELAEWDVYRLPDKKDCNIKYSTTEKDNADIVQSIGVCAWYRTHINTYEDKRKEYTVSFTLNREYTSFNPLKVNTYNYRWHIYCVTVPSGVIITRYNDTTFISGNSEVRHLDAYSHLLELLWLNKDFENIDKIPAIQDRITYLDKAKKTKTFTNNLILFSLFIEHISLFSQFLIIMSFNKHKNVLKGISNAVEATSKEENLHGMFGIDLANIIKEEHPELFTEEHIKEIIYLAEKALKAELKVIDWIFSDGDLDFLSKETTMNYIKDRFNNAFKEIGIDHRFEVNDELLGKTEWFDEELNATKHTDFFYKRPVNYNKKSQSITEDDLFD